MRVGAICILCLLTLVAASENQCELMLLVFYVYLLWWLLVRIHEKWCYVYCVFTYFGGCAWESMRIGANCIVCLLISVVANGNQCELMLFVCCVYLF